MIVALAILAVYRVAHMIASEEGPFEICTRFRNLHLADDWIGRGMRCPLCIGFWLALPAALLVTDQQLVLYWFGIAGAQMIIHRLGDGYAR